MEPFSIAHDFLLSLIRNTPYGIIGLDPEGKVMVINDNALQHFGWKKNPNYYTGKEIGKILDAQTALGENLMEKISRQTMPFDIDEVFHNGKYLRVLGRPIDKGLLITTSDITVLKAIEVDEMNAMLAGQENERKRLSREIHDGVGPILSTIKINMESIQTDLGELPLKTAKKFETVNHLIQTMAHDIRSISHSLMPSAVEDFGVTAALQNLCEKANLSGKVEVLFYHSTRDERLDPNIELGLYRIGQELLNNAIKYAKADTISVQLIRYPESILLIVEDDGIGFPDGFMEEEMDGIGLKNIQIRTKTLGGVFHIDAPKGEGTIATVEIPVDKMNGHD